MQYTKELVKCSKCGADCSPTDKGLGTGYAAMPNGDKVCHPCADEIQREELKTAQKYSVYVGKGIVTTWTGGKLGDIVNSWSVGHNWGGTGIAYTIKDIHGQHWYGRHVGNMAGQGMLLNIHRSKRK